MALLNMTDQIYNWFVDYYNGHSHRTSFCDAFSNLFDITASIIQGSGTCPASYVKNAADMHTIQKENILVKFVEYTSLIVAAANEGTCTAKLMSIKNWAMQNNLTLTKSKPGIVFWNPASKSRQTSEPPPTPMCIMWKSEVKTLGVTLYHGFSMKTHFDSITTSWSHMVYHKRVCMSSSSPPSCHGSCVLPKRGPDLRVRGYR